MVGGVALPDPFVLNDVNNVIVYRQTSGLTVRSAVINPALKTLILIAPGQSNVANVNPTLYTPANAGVVDQFNIYDGAIYNVGGPLLGTDYDPTVGTLGPGNVAARVADLLVTNARFDRVIIVACAIGSTTMTMWGDSTGAYVDRVPCALRRLASRGITPSTAGVTFASLLMIGESDNVGGTSQAAWTASFNSFVAAAAAAGFSGRHFVPQETWDANTTSAAVRAAQAAVVNGTTVFSGGDLDTLTATSRVGGAAGVHFNDAGAASAATLIYNAMHASGAPY